MAQLFTTTDLIASVKSRAMIPTSQSTYQNVDFLRFATEELQVGLLPMLLSIREEFFVHKSDTSVVADQQLYPIPERAVGRILRDIMYTSDNPVTLRSSMQSLARMDPDQLSWGSGSFNSSNALVCYMQDDSVGLHPLPTQSSGSIRFSYHRRPSCLVEPSATSKVVSIDSATVITVDAVPTTLDNSKLVDIVTATGGFRSKGDDLALDSVTSPTITFTNDLPSDLAVGDYISLAGESPIPQIPLELQPILAQRVAIKCLEGLGDERGGMSIAQAKLNEMEKAAFTLITPRIRGEAKKISSQNHFANSYRR